MGIEEGCETIEEGCEAIEEGCEGIEEGCEGIEEGCEGIEEGCEGLFLAVSAGIFGNWGFGREGISVKKEDLVEF